MNKALKKYKCHYKHTRYAAKLIGALLMAKRAMASAQAASGLAMLNQFLFSCNDAERKRSAINDFTVKSQMAASKAYTRIKMPKWYKPKR